ncbi:MAG: 3-oxoacyl-[acyl-carrier-protein] reductase [Candidatus Sericytochromatia bacterium]
MQRELDNQVALVTGASRGIGRACAERLAAAGAHVVVNYHANPEEAEELCLRLEAEQGVQTLCMQADVGVLADVEALFAAVQARFGRLDILVNNAGITRDQLLLRLKPEDWEAVLATNLTGVFHCCKAAARMMLRQKSGRIVNMASVVGQTGNAGQTHYAASKAGVLGFTKSLALELASRGIAVNAVAPGYIDSEMTAVLPEALRESQAKKIPWGRFGTCEEVAEVVLFLSSERSRYLTGQTLNVDGGLVMN